MAQFDLVASAEKPAGYETFLENPNGPVFKGGGPHDYRCGSCKRVLFESVEYKQVQGVAARCSKCSKYNVPSPAHHTN